jgi:tRNA uridine 5-carboxymethylaminomethyl modification enzyme
VSEPYRMLTSRAEYRLSLRADNADQRLTPKGIAIGCVGAPRAGHFAAAMKALEAARRLARSLAVTPNEAERHGLALNKDGQRRSAFELLSYPGISIDQLRGVWPELGLLPHPIAQQIETDAKYSVYLERQAADVAAYRRDDALQLPDDLDYEQIQGLSTEVRQKLQTARPRTIGQAARLDGVTPAGLTLLAARIRKPRKSAGVA